MPNTEPDGPFWESFPNMLPGAIPEKIGRSIPWHTHADSPQSSQTFCVSAFGSLIGNDSRNKVCRQLAEWSSEHGARQDGEWRIYLEFSDRSLLNEVIGTPTQIDALIVGPDSVIAVESKLAVDALEGFGCCSKFRDRSCRGHYGPGSDARHPASWCMLEQWDGRRSPRMYWTLGRSYFRPSIFVQQHIGHQCPFRDSNYQLMRVFLSAAIYAHKQRKKFFSTLLLCPRALSAKMASQAGHFKDHVVLPEHKDRVSLMHYEEYIALLRETGNAGLRKTAQFLSARLESLVSLKIDPPPV